MSVQRRELKPFKLTIPPLLQTSIKCSRQLPVSSSRTSKHASISLCSVVHTTTQLAINSVILAVLLTIHLVPHSHFSSPSLFIAFISLLVNAGFPPKTLQAPDTNLVSSVFRNGDVIIVNKSAQNSNQNHTTAPKQHVAPVQSFSENPPVSSTSEPKQSANANDSIASQGSIVLREVPDDNSCLFRSVNSILGFPSRSPAYLRQIIAEHVMNNQDQFSEVVLGKTCADYAAWILSDHAWGGAIELSILARHFQVQIAAFDVHTMRLDRYGEDNHFPTVGFLIYDGIHYNYVALSLSDSIDMDIFQFDSSDAYVVQKVRQLAQHLHDSKSYTDTASFKLTCMQCGITMKGEQQALEHAKTTGHSQFDEN